MSATISFRDQLSPALRRKLDRLRDKRPILEAGGAALAGLAQRAFRDAALRPSTWPALAPSTLERKGGRGNMLIDTGALFSSIGAQPPSAERIEVGTDRPYAPFLQHGTAKMPARPFVPFQDDTRLTPAAEREVREAMQARLDAIAGE